MQVDEVARAIFGVDRCSSTRCPQKVWGWDRLSARQQETYRRMAQAAMDALDPANAG